MWELGSPAGWRCKGIHRCSREVKLSQSLMRFRGSRKTWIFIQARQKGPWQRSKENKVICTGIKLTSILSLKYILHLFIVSDLQCVGFPFSNISWLWFKTAAQQKPQCTVGMLKNNRNNNKNEIIPMTVLRGFRGWLLWSILTVLATFSCWLSKIARWVKGEEGEITGRDYKINSIDCFMCVYLLETYSPLYPTQTYGFHEPYVIVCLYPGHHD